MISHSLLNTHHPTPTQAHLERLTSLFHRSPLAQSFGLQMHFDEQRRAVFDLPYDGRFDHFLNDVHGGAIATLIDNAGWFTAAAHYPTWVVSVEFSVRLHLPAKSQALRAVGTLVRSGKRITSTEMTVHNEDGDLIATGAGTFSITTAPLPD